MKRQPEIHSQSYLLNHPVSYKNMVVRVPVLGLPVLLASGTLWTAGTQSFWPPRYPVDWRDSVLSAARYSGDWQDSVLSAPTRRYPVAWRDSVVVATRYPVDWWESVLQAPGTLWTGGTPYFWPPRYPGDWWDSVVSVPPGTLWTGGTQSFRPSRNLGTGRHGRTCLPRNVKREKRGLVFVLEFIGLFL